MSLSPAGRPAERGVRGQRPPTENLNDFPPAGEAGETGGSGGSAPRQRTSMISIMISGRVGGNKTNNLLMMMMIFFLTTIIIIL